MFFFIEICILPDFLLFYKIYSFLQYLYDELEYIRGILIVTVLMKIYEFFFSTASHNANT
jgi:hypothetical protein